MISIKDLPLPPSGKQGWPWTEETSKNSYAATGTQELPKISIVTPNLNYGHFLEETIRSVLLQNYPNLEFIVLDAGSTDSSLEIIERYKQWITFFKVEKGQTQTQAINQGLRESSGEIFNWLNSDDLLMPGALHQIGGLCSKFPDFQWLTGGRMMINEASRDLYCELMWPSSQTLIAYGIPNFPQDATFFRRKSLLEIGVRDDLQNGFDSYLQFEFLRRHPVLLTRGVFSKMRLHAHQKTRNIDRRKLEHQNAIEPCIRSLPLRSRWCYATCLGKFGPLFTGIFEEYRQWKKGDLLLSEAWYDFAQLQWRLVKR